jgi:hypothetical protein
MYAHSIYGVNEDDSIFQQILKTHLIYSSLFPNTINVMNAIENVPYRMYYFTMKIS